MRIGVGRKRRFPLAGVLGVAPAGAVRLDVALGAFLESDPLGVGKGACRPLSASMLDRVYPLMSQPARVQRLRTGILRYMLNRKTRVGCGTKE